MDLYVLYYGMTIELKHVDNQAIQSIFKAVSYTKGAARKVEACSNPDDIRIDSMHRTEIDTELDNYYRGNNE